MTPKRCPLSSNKSSYTRKNASKKSAPKLPSFGVIDDCDAYLAEVDDAAIDFVQPKPCIRGSSSRQ
jgi:hypothetical protein